MKLIDITAVIATIVFQDAVNQNEIGWAIFITVSKFAAIVFTTVMTLIIIAASYVCIRLYYLMKRNHHYEF